MAHNGRLLWVVLPQLYFLTGTAIVSGSWRQKQKLENILKMAASGKVIESPRKLNLRPLGVESDTVIPLLEQKCGGDEIFYGT